LAGIGFLETEQYRGTFCSGLHAEPRWVSGETSPLAAVDPKEV
jgi:hypothetical protein